MFQMVTSQINYDEYKNQMQSSETGALISFQGTVRNNNEDKPVEALYYEAYKELAVKEGSKILHESMKKFDILDVCCIHRTGDLEIGDTAILIIVSSGHRQAGFLACEYIINEVKLRLPIWKKETYQNGEVKWVNCCSHDNQSNNPL